MNAKDVEMKNAVAVINSWEKGRRQAPKSPMRKELDRDPWIEIIKEDSDTTRNSQSCLKME